MTLAICLRCGAHKIGAWTRCRTCGFLPESEEDLACSILLSDQLLNHVELATASARIKAGELPQFDPDELGDLIADLKTHRDRYARPSRQIVGWASAIAIALLLGGLIVFLLHG